MIISQIPQRLFAAVFFYKGIEIVHIFIQSFLLLGKLQFRLALAAGTNKFVAVINGSIGAEMVSVQIGVFGVYPRDLLGGKHIGIKMEFFKSGELGKDAEIMVLKIDVEEVNLPQIGKTLKAIEGWERMLAKS